MARSILSALLAATFLISSGPVIGAKPAPPTPPPPTASPEVAYVRISGGTRRFYELKMSNEDGSGAVTVFSSREVGQMLVDLGPRADKTLLLVQGGRLSLMVYEITSNGPRMKSLEQIIDMAHAGGATAAISSTGTDVAFLKNGERTVWAYNIASKSFTKLADGAADLGGIGFSPDGQTIYYLEYVGPKTLALKSVPLSGGPPTDLGVRGNYTELSTAPNGDILLVDLSGYPTYRIYSYTPGGGAPTYLTNGYASSVKCDGSAVMVQRLNPDSSVSLIRRDLPGGTEHVFSSKDLYWPDYMPTC